MGSNRLPGKMLINLHGYPIIEWINRRLAAIKNIKVVFAIPDSKENDILSNYLLKLGSEVFRGSENDLVDRFFNVTKKFNPKKVIRVCGDNPLVCPEAIKLLIDFFNCHQCDYAYNHIPVNNNWPDGLGAEICNSSLIEEIFYNSNIDDHREHIFNFIWANSDKYSIKTFDAPLEVANPSIKLDIDTFEDYSNLMSKPYHIDITSSEIVSLNSKYL